MEGYSKERYSGLGHVPIGIGAIIKGWNIPEEHVKNPDALSVVDFRAMTHACQWNCFHCFTDKLKKTLTLEEIKSIIDQLADLRTKTIDFLGEGEPTLDKDFFDIIEYTAAKGIQPVVFTDGATKLREKAFVKRLYQSGASVCLKCDSLWNKEFQNWVVGDTTGHYFDQRKEALDLLIEEGFAKTTPDGTTRLGFDMVVCKKNVTEVEKTLRYCREHNLWIMFTFYIPAGRSNKPSFDISLSLSKGEKQQVRDIIRKVDEEYGFKHDVMNNFLTCRCLEFMCIYGDGRVAPCVGNETIIGNAKTETITALRKKILERFPIHNPGTFDGYCPYRERF
ncbi:MAG: radical SAM protein [Nanoarchaeota archaeon]|nr:radical SAM protein [Nanoarchaeota archaeon]